MPLSHLSPQALPGNSSNSKKRSYAEITRSESRSQSPQLSSKRRRTMTTPHSPSSSTSSTYSPIGIRFVHDGFDYRRPAMSATPRTIAHDQDTIDLTLEDDTPPIPQSTIAQNVPWAELSDNESSGYIYRAPPFRNQHQPVIDLTSGDDDSGEEDDIPFNGQTYAEGGTRVAPSSPEIEFVGARTLPQPRPTGNVYRNQSRPPPLPTLGSMATFLNMSTNMFANLAGRREHPEVALNRIDGINDLAGERPAGAEAPDEFNFDEYETLEMDYGRAAFGFDHQLLVNFPHMAATRPNESAYKEPTQPRDGYTRNYDEDDMLICGLCEDELATGSTEQKQQVWVIKQCGHAYCGDCAHNRNMSKQKNSKDTKRLAGKKTNGFKSCAVPDCTKSVDSKTKMFQIYL